MPSSIVKTLVVAALAFTSITSASPVDVSTRDLEKRGSWTSQSTCPSGDGDEYDGPRGGAWRINCGYDTTNVGYIKMVQASSFIDCIQQCGADAYPTDGSPPCGRVTYTSDVGSPGPCYFKTGASDLQVSVGRKVATKLNP